MKLDITVVYLTDDTIAPDLLAFCQKIFQAASSELDVISVSQTPTAIGRNICVGPGPRNWIGLYSQLLTGLEEVRTDYVAVAEHDVLYTREHFMWRPARDNGADRTLWYNSNNWLVQFRSNRPELTGVYTHWRRRPALSQLITGSVFFRDHIRRTLHAILNNQRIKEVASDSFGAKIGKWLPAARFDFFETKTPNVDIRHSTNLTGPRRGGIGRRYSLEPWGRFDELWQKYQS